MFFSLFLEQERGGQRSNAERLHHCTSKLCVQTNNASLGTGKFLVSKPGLLMHLGSLVKLLASISHECEHICSRNVPGRLNKIEAS